MNRGKALALLLVVIAFGGTTVTFAETNGTTNLDLSSSSVSFANVTTNPDDGPNKQQPDWDPVIEAAGEIPNNNGNQKGELYKINTSGYQGDLRISLYYNNPADLSGSYSYLNLNVTVWEKSGTGWEREGSNILSLSNGYVVFNAEQTNDGVFYVSISGGSFYATDDANLSPEWYLEVNQG